MRKIPSLYVRDYDGDRLVRDEVVPGSEWVLAGEGQPTIKLDGTCCMVKGGVLYKRYDAKKGKTPPEGFLPAQEEPDPDEFGGHWPGWVTVGGGPEDRYHREALSNCPNGSPFRDGTYELLGPKVQGNAYSLLRYQLSLHGQLVLVDLPEKLSYESIRDYLKDKTPWIEGIVWHHEDGRMVKVKRKDFGFPWPK
ncbi:MAG: DUF5565 family protein [Candidatus Methylomirabilales bacterium]